MTEALKKLLEPFPAEAVGKLPRVTCPKCSDRRQTCQEHEKDRCNVCKAYVSERHIHLDYVGHADVTRRLIEVDPTWSWEPAAVDENGLPLLDTDDKDNPVGMWIKLTVAGVTRLGYGSCPSNQNDAVKVLIGDALRNAAMRFGVALDLWAKGDRADPAAENATASGGTARRRAPRATAAQPQAAPAENDQAWVVDFEQRLNTCSSVQQVEELKAELMAKFKANKLEPGKANELIRATRDRKDQLEEAAA